MKGFHWETYNISRYVFLYSYPYVFYVLRRFEAIPKGYKSHSGSSYQWKVVFFYILIHYTPISMSLSAFEVITSNFTIIHDPVIYTSKTDAQRHLQMWSKYLRTYTSIHFIQIFLPPAAQQCWGHVSWWHWWCFMLPSGLWRLTPWPLRSPGWGLLW